ncbi:hypothetical protein LEA_11769, partial [human gut metagenome]
GYAIERKQQGIVVANELSWEMKKFYNAEFQVGLKALYPDSVQIPGYRHITAGRSLQSLL